MSRYVLILFQSESGKKTKLKDIHVTGKQLNSPGRHKHFFGVNSCLFTWHSSSLSTFLVTAQKAFCYYSHFIQHCLFSRYCQLVYLTEKSLQMIKASFRLSVQIGFLCISDWNPKVFSKCERHETTWNPIFTNLFWATFIWCLKSVKSHFWNFVSVWPL